MDELSPEQRDELARDLTRLKGELEESLASRAEQSKPVELDKAAIGRVSRMDAIQQQNVAKATRRNNQVRLELVRQALGALRDGEYGLCRRCDEPIGFKRLKVRPEAAFCVRCQK